MQTASKLQLDITVVGEMEKLRTATDLLLGNANAFKAFQAVEEGHGKASGWNIARSVNMPAADAENLLTQLKEAGVIDSTGAGLDGYYYLTKLGFALRGGVRVAV